MDDYKYLFPFENIKKNEKIIIYGAGYIGIDYLRQIYLSSYCDVICFLDKNATNIHKMKIPVYMPETIKRLKYDHIVLALEKMNMQDVVETLQRYGVDREKIVGVGKRNRADNIFVSEETSFARKTMAFDLTYNSVAIRVPRHLGDCIQRKAAIVELSKLFKGCRIDLYAQDTSSAEAILRDLPGINEIIIDGGALYYQFYKKYMLAIEIRFTLLIDNINRECIPDTDTLSVKYLNVIENDVKKYNINVVPITQSRVHIERAIYSGWNCYDWYNYISVFHIHDWHVTIPMDIHEKEKYEKLNLGNYITVNYGNGITSKGNRMTNTRQWPFVYFENIVKLVKDRYPCLKVIQIGDNNSINISNADSYILGESIELAKYVLKNSILHIDSEGGLTHLATQLGTKCCVMFGPTQVEAFGYKNNINIVSPYCKGCYYLYDEPFICARGYETPRCMEAITPEMVFERITDYLDSVI